MTQFFRLRNAYNATAWTGDLGTDRIRLGTMEEEGGLTELAQHCQAGASSVVIDDPSGNLLALTGANVLGLQRFEWDETDMAVGSRRIATCIIGEQHWERGKEGSRGSLRVSAAAQVMLQLHDLNALLSLRSIPQSDTAANRPAETIAVRLAWILGSTYLSGLVADNGLVNPPAITMDAADYRQQRPVNVINDCELAALGYNAFVYGDETKTTVGSLFFDDPNTSTAFASTLRISNVLSDVDTGTAATFTTGTTFAPSIEAELTRSPTEVGDAVDVPYAGGIVHKARAATTSTFGHKGLVAPNANIKSADKAEDLADQLLRENASEEDVITVSVEVPTSKVNSIRAGHRIQVKFSHLPGYTSFTWCRVARRTVIQGEATDRYILDLELSPQETFPTPGNCVDIYPNTPSDTYYPLGGYDTAHAHPSDGVIQYWRAGYVVPSSPDEEGETKGWHFAALGAGGVGTIDYAGDCVGNHLVLISVGNGTWTIQTERYGGTVRRLQVYTGPTFDYSNVASINSGDSVEVVIDDATNGDCIRITTIVDDGSAGCGSKWGFSEAVWVAA